MLGTKALSASYIEVIFAFFNKHFGEFYTAEQLMGKGSQSLLPYSSSHSEEQEVVAPEGESDDEDCTPFLKVNNKGMSGTFDMGSKDFGRRFLRKGDLEPPDLSFSSVAANSAGLSIQSQGRVTCLFARALQAYEEGKMVVDAKQMQEILLLDRLSGYLRALVWNEPYGLRRRRDVSANVESTSAAAASHAAAAAAAALSNAAAAAAYDALFERSKFCSKLDPDVVWGILFGRRRQWFVDAAAEFILYLLTPGWHVSE